MHQEMSVSLPVPAPVPSEPGEEWRPVVGFPDYLVSSLGRVCSFKYRQPHILRAWTAPNGYRQVALCANDTRKNALVHRIVAAAFLGPRPDGWETRHLNSVKTDNRLANLTYGTPMENALDRVVQKTHCIRGHKFDEENTAHYLRGDSVWRRCRACSRLRARGAVSSVAR